jgi:NDP-sugar pyrophosphorylase family protein
MVIARVSKGGPASPPFSFLKNKYGRLINMQAVILAAGRGTRMGKLTEEFPKALLPLAGKTLLEYKLEALPENISEVIIVIQHKGDLIEQKFGNKYLGKKITYITDQTLSGTAHALWQAKNILSGRFLVMMGDDIYSRESFEECSHYDASIVCKPANREENGSRITIDKLGHLTGFLTDKAYKEKFQDGGMIFTGLYSLTPKIFEFEPVKLKTKEEWGLPQTVLSASKEIGIQILKTNFWISVNSEVDLKFAEKILSTTLV